MSKPLHPKASALQRAGLFAGLKSFAELEARIAALRDEKARGDALEVFAEAYLATQRKHDAAHVWPHGSMPLDVLKNLGLTQQDQGVDGVLQTLLGQFDAYQVKFRAGRPALTWRELSTFIGLADSPRIHSRVLLTNCDELPAVLNDRQGFFCIRGADLDRLEGEDLRAIEAWLAEAAYTAPKKTPQPHQAEGLAVLLPALQTHDRVSAIMACGTGKTLLALWIAEHVARASQLAGSGDFRVANPDPGLESPVNPRTGMSAPRILVLVPSLALLRQTLHEWLRETSLPKLAYLCVCSDPTVKEGLDALTTTQSDLDFQVSTDAASVRRFLDAPFAGVKLVFSTYQSASVVDAALQPGEAFDFAVFDEAHKTAGREGRNFGFALEDKNLPIRKRLFLTATPRHYNPRERDREGEAKLVFSMDNPEVYGPQAYRLTFAEAARRGFICGYKVIISVITSEMVTNEILSRGEVIVNGDAVRARQVANQIALRDAIEKYGASKAFTFHRTVASAASFVADGSEGIRTHLSEFETFHVNGKMPSAHGERVMRDFQGASRAVISNARCLTEGVDVPAVDMVAFLSPRRSRVDIVQATGRAMRKLEGSDKTTGYVLVPLYLEQAAAETVEQAVQRSEFDEVWEVLQAMQEQDEVLAEIIRGMREERGRTKGFDDSRFRERVEILGPEISLAELTRSITTTCIEQLADDWEERFGELKAFKGRFDTCKVLDGWSENPRLAAWVRKQRSRRKTMRKDRFRRLDEIGFLWDAKDAAWEDGFALLLEYRKAHRTCDVPVRCEEYPRLGRWVHMQRVKYKDRNLCADRIRRLEAIGFRWDPYADWWEEWFAKLTEFKKLNDHCEVSRNDPKYTALASWINSQRTDRRDGKLSEERIRRLTELGTSWDARTDLWEQRFSELVEFKKAHGDCLVPSASREHRRLFVWVCTQRQFWKDGKLSADRIRRLDQLGFVWNSKDAAWEAMFSEMVKFWKVRRHCNVPQGWPENPKLGAWVNTQRLFRRKGKISRLNPERIRRLDQMGFQWGNQPPTLEDIHCFSP